MTGKAGVAPCGHVGEYLTTNYVRCLQGCDATRTPTVDPDEMRCPYCRSYDTTEIPQCFPGDATTHCFDCGGKF